MAKPPSEQQPFLSGQALPRRIASMRRPRLVAGLVLASLLVLVLCLHVHGLDNVLYRRRRMRIQPLDTLPPRAPCVGPRGELLTESPDDQLLKKKSPSEFRAVAVGGERRFCMDAYPQSQVRPIPFMGSQRELGLSETWMTADDRYGPYGFGETKPTYGRSRVDWDSLDWGDLMDQCLDRNAHRFPDGVPSTMVANDTRFALRSPDGIDPTAGWQPSPNPTHRTALVLRSFEGQKYTKETMWMVRSLITETALQSGGRYGVILLVNIQNRHWKIHESRANYDRAFRSLNVPPELRSITLLWDDRLLESWYPLVDEHR